jgi:LmbE family N-acetylglucosaminyl deacetylase
MTGLADHIGGRRAAVLLVEDDALLAVAFSEILAALADVTCAPTGEDAVAMLGADPRTWDLIVADVELPGMSGIEFLEILKARAPKVATLVLSSHASFEYAVAAIRAGADDYMTKPVEPQAAIEKAAELIALTERRRAAGHEVVLAVGAHPDDVEIGCGGILLRHVAAGHEVAILTLTGGEAGGVATARALEAARAAELLSARLFLTDLQDMSVGDGGPTIATIKRVIDETKATTVYTHTAHDVHQDHRNVNRATFVAARGVPRVHCYQSPSTTVEFRPTRFVSIDDFIERKLEVIRAYVSQTTTRHYLDEELLRATARYWGRFAQSRYVEPLEVGRDSEAGSAAAVSIPYTQEVSADAL